MLRTATDDTGIAGSSSLHVSPFYAAKKIIKNKKRTMAIMRFLFSAS